MQAQQEAAAQQAAALEAQLQDAVAADAAHADESESALEAAGAHLAVLESQLREAVSAGAAHVPKETHTGRPASVRASFEHAPHLSSDSAFFGSPSQKPLRHARVGRRARFRSHVGGQQLGQFGEALPVARMGHGPRDLHRVEHHRPGSRLGGSAGHSPGTAVWKKQPGGGETGLRGANFRAGGRRGRPHHHRPGAGFAHHEGFHDHSPLS